MNAWCEILNIEVPSLRKVRGHPDANTYALLLVALLERGVPMTLEEVAGRFEEAGIASADDALRSLKRCRPARPPVYRDGDLYEVDPYSDDLDLWAFRLGLRPPKVQVADPPPQDPAPLPGPDVPLTPEELEDAFCDAYVWSWSALRVAMAVLDAHGGRLPEQRLFQALDRMGTRHSLRADSPLYWQGRGVAVSQYLDWILDPADPSIPAMRDAVRKRVESVRRYRARSPDAAVQQARERFWEECKRAHRAELAGLRRAVLYATPSPGTGSMPAAVTLLDVASRQATTWIGGAVEGVAAALASVDVVAAMEVRPLLRSLGVDPQARRLDDLSPPQKSCQGPGGRTVRITTEMLIRGSCGIPRPFAGMAALRRTMERGDDEALRRWMEAGARSLLALYEYGRLHGAVRLRHAGLDEWFRVPWVHPDEIRLYGLMKEAARGSGWLEVVLGPAPTGENPWAATELCRVVPWPGTYWTRLVDLSGRALDERDVQRARIPEGPVGGGGLGLEGGPASVASVSSGLRTLARTPPWAAREDSYLVVRRALEDRAVPESDRVLAMGLAGNLGIMRDELAHALLRVAEDPGESEPIRAAAVIALGPALEEADAAVFDGTDEVSISGIMFRHIQETLRRLYHSPDVPPELRRSILEASVRAHADWHGGAVRTAFLSEDPRWRLTAIFCALYVPGFDDEVIEALSAADPVLVFEAIRVAGSLGLREAEEILSALAEGADEELAEAAFDALMEMRKVDEALDFDDEDFLDDAGDSPPRSGSEGWGGGVPGKGGPTFH